MFTRAIVRPPTENLADGLTSVSFGVPDFPTALAQHGEYCRALKQCGLELVTLAPDNHHPDATFVEDTAVLTAKAAILTHPGATSRREEIRSVETSLSKFFPQLLRINAQSGNGVATLDGGDVCEAGEHFFIGISARTNEAGAQQLASFLGQLGYTASLIDIREVKNILHLKSGIAHLGDRRLALIDALADLPAFREYECVQVPGDDEYAANCVRVNDHVLLPAGNGHFARSLKHLGYQTIVLDMSEFRKMDGGLSCLSLRF